MSVDRLKIKGQSKFIAGSILIEDCSNEKQRLKFTKALEFPFSCRVNFLEIQPIANSHLITYTYSNAIFQVHPLFNQNPGSHQRRCSSNKIDHAKSRSLLPKTGSIDKQLSR